MFCCKHCNKEINTLDNVSNHSCFFGKAVYMEESENILFTIEEKQSTSYRDHETCNQPSETPCFATNNEPADQAVAATPYPDKETSFFSVLNNEPEDQAASKQHFVWDRNATLGLLSLYEANMGMMDHPKKKTKIWEAISIGLKQFEIQVTSDQVRWKMNALLKKYKEIVDNNSKSGRGVIEFQWFDQMDEIFGKQKNAAKRHTVSSKFPALPSPSSSNELEKKRHHEPLEKASTSKCDSIVTNDNGKRLRASHGTGSNIAKTKVELEKQWLQYLRNKEQTDHMNDNKYASSNEYKKEGLKLKKSSLP